MSQPKGFEKMGFEEFVCLLKKSLYGLRISPRIWQKTLQKYLKSRGFDVCVTCPCAYVYKNRAAFVLIYVDVALICGAREEDVNAAKEILAEWFEIKDLGNATHFLGIRISRNADGTIVLSHETSIKTFLQRFAHDASRPVFTLNDAAGVAPQRSKEDSFEGEREDMSKNHTGSL
eukprot:Plantae.Rhodophyta-Palmaria_palmata.ctg3483.p1 GENE.Plantae.Rhodophyta-Palmaria_palmata.ctg3483~~Plantae.Rhodophyta-Palmaria_palmata.ctg3483.p1  ORF type:complete len:175 (-),score=34.48 Plantae.Rhodophyta-Palmaria_palmata.ctg3483:330-854(-)